MRSSHRLPAAVGEWIKDIPDGDLDAVYVFDDGTVCVAGGRYAHSSGSSACTWAEFIDGQLNEVVLAKYGAAVLSEVRAKASNMLSLRANNVTKVKGSWWKFWQ